ncbi:MAG: 4'-phosphopantetheinyl transferase superfamily protein [Candidatus Paracaedibacteraceae bacterium]|nr:4'-phosphopantetheinyl transferase superfamily protein [Candidatus Paracaedibacteraceae bacterium]
MKISNGDVHVWFSLTKELNDVNLLARYKGLLSQDECKRFNSFFYKKDRQLYLISRALLRTTLSEYSLVSPCNWKFSKNNNGKPFINNKNLSEEKICFNLSHTDGLVMVGVTKMQDIGVDVEQVSRNFDYMDIAYSNFAADEITVLESMSGSDQKEFFYKYWTLKESYLKARGDGLTMPLNLCSFALSTCSKIKCKFFDQAVDCHSNWNFLQFSLVKNYISSICLKRNQNYSPRIRVRHCVPLINNKELKNIKFLSS